MPRSDDNSGKKNRFVAAGSFGCVYGPSVRCDKKSTSHDTVGKIFVKGRSARHNIRDFHEELNSNDLMREINTQGKFTITDEGDCYVSGEALTDDEKISCAATSRDSTARSQTMELLNNDKIPQIIYKKGGVPLHELWNNDVPLTRFLVYFQNVIEGLVKLNETGYAHMDIKPANILYNPENNRANLIDFGHLGSEDRLYSDSQSHLTLLAHHYVYYPPEFKVLFMFSMGISRGDLNPRILEKVLPVYLFSLQDEFVLRECRDLDFPLMTSKLNLLFSREVTRENAGMIERVEQSLHKKLEKELAQKYDMVFERFKHETRNEQIRGFLWRLKEELFFDSFEYSHIKLASMEKLFLNEKFGSMIDVYSIGVSLMDVIYQFLMPIMLGKDVNKAQEISRETHEIIICLLYIISGMVYPDPFMRLSAEETRWLYTELVHAIGTNSSAERQNLIQNIEIYVGERIPS